MANPGSNGEAIDNPLERERPVKALLRLTETALFLRSTGGRFYARVQVRGRPEIYALGSPAFRAWLIDQYFRTCNDVASDWSIRRALAKLEATARFEGGTLSIFNRVGHEGDDYGVGSASYLDLADPIGRAIRISSEGWSIVEDPPVHFRRRAGHLPLPMPIRGGSIELLRRYVNVTSLRLQRQSPGRGLDLSRRLAADGHPARARPPQARLGPDCLRLARGAQHVGRQKGYCLARLAENAAVALGGTAPHRPPIGHARRLHYVPQNPRKAFHRDHEHKTSDTGRAAGKCG